MHTAVVLLYEYLSISIIYNILTTGRVNAGYKYTIYIIVG